MTHQVFCVVSNSRQRAHVSCLGCLGEVMGYSEDGEVLTDMHVATSVLPPLSVYSQ